MKSVTIDSKKLALVQLVMSIDTEQVLDKAVRYLKRVTSVTNTGYSISEETAAMIEHSRKEYCEGKVHSFSSINDAQKWLESL